MKPKTREQKRVASLIGRSTPIGKRAIKRVEEGLIAREMVKKCYFSQWERIEEYQVFRYFEVCRNLRTGKVKYIDEKFRNYLNCETKEQTIVALQYNGLTSCRSSLPVFNQTSRLEVRNPHCQSGGWYIMDDYHDSRCYDTYVKSVHPEFAKSKVTPQMTEEFGSYTFLHEVYNSAHKSKIETALMWGDTYLVWCLTHPRRFTLDIDTLWRSMLIARRHGMDFKEVDYKEFADYLQQLRALGLDIRSPKYLCPDNFQAEHERVGRLVQRKEARERMERERTKAQEENEKYVREHYKFFSIAIKAEGLTIAPLTSVSAFLEEGEAMHHCVYSCHYYDKADTLILSARDEKGERVETIEYNTKERKVYQSRGLCNKQTPMHDTIVREVEAQMPKWLALLKMGAKAKPRHHSRIAC